MIWFVLVSSIFSIFTGLITTTKDVKSVIHFKVIPFFLGLGSLIYFLKTIGWI